jgi:hypothetical protein
MNPSQQLLFGPYRAPRFKVGQTVTCAICGEIEIVGLTDGRIPWPIGKRGRHKSIILFGSLVQAVKRESGLAICYWWGCSTTTATKWRKALGIGSTNPGSRELRSKNFQGDVGRRARAAALPVITSPEYSAKRKRLAKTLPKQQMSESHRKAFTYKGRTPSVETKAKRQATRQRLQSASRNGGRTWTPLEDELLRHLEPKIVAKLTGHSVAGAYQRRQRLGLAETRARKARAR